MTVQFLVNFLDKTHQICVEGTGRGTGTGNDTDKDTLFEIRKILCEQYDEKFTPDVISLKIDGVDVDVLDDFRFNYASFEEEADRIIIVRASFSANKLCGGKVSTYQIFHRMYFIECIS